MQELKEYVRGKITGISMAVSSFGFHPEQALRFCIVRRGEILHPFFPNRRESFCSDLYVIIASMHILMNYESDCKTESDTLRELNKHEAYLVDLCEYFMEVHG